MWKRDLGVALIAGSGAVIANTALTGLGPDARLVVLLVMFVVMLTGFGLLASLEGDLPLWLRSRKWALREIKRLTNDPSHPLRRPYMASSGGYKDVSEWEHKRALEAVHALYDRAYTGRWKRTSTVPELKSR